jgi:acetylornithine deacetylase/succinyl-diaminopimelate desuccinylase-like protein
LLKRLPPEIRQEMSAFDAAFTEVLPNGLSELAELVAIPSVAAKPDSPMRACAELVAALLEKRGLQARLLPTNGGPPVVYAEDRSAGVDAPTVLFYNHYDVQPAEPYDLWDSDPWQLTQSDDLLVARGVTDDKGHILCRLLAIDCLRKTHNNALPVNIKVLIEGEEEVASVHLEEFMSEHYALLNADVTLWEFGGINQESRPELVCGLRGIATFELRVKTIAYDAHSGIGGGIFPNAAWRLVWALASLKSQSGEILLKNHTDSAILPTQADLALLAKLSPEIESSLKSEYGLEAFLGNATGLDAHRQQIFEPTITINGISSGWQGSGMKTVLPSEASAKLDFRLVPDMDPEQVHQNLRRHLDNNGFSDIEVHYFGGQKAGRCDPTGPMIALAAKTALEVYGVEATILPLSPVTGPAHPFCNGLRQPIVTIGCGYPGGRAHAPNENLRLSDLKRGVEHTVRFLEELYTVLNAVDSIGAFGDR